MNGSCAGGTGAFIDQMAILLDVTPTELDELAQGAERIDGIALALARHLEVEHLDLDAALKRGLSAHETRHGETVLVRGTSLLHHLVRRDTRRNEQELIQRALLRRLDGGVLVPQMRRVEAAAVNSDLQ